MLIPFQTPALTLYPGYHSYANAFPSKKQT